MEKTTIFDGVTNFFKALIKGLKIVMAIIAFLAPLAFAIMALVTGADHDKIVAGGWVELIVGLFIGGLFVFMDPIIGVSMDEDDIPILPSFGVGALLGGAILLIASIWM